MRAPFPVFLNLVLEHDGAQMTVIVCKRFDGIHARCVANAFLECFLHLFVILPISRRVAEILAIELRDPAPGLHQRQKVRLAPLAAGLVALGADGSAVLEELIEYRHFLFVVTCPYGIDAVTGRQDLVAVEDLLHLHRVVGNQLGGGIDGRQAPADDTGGQAHLQVGHGRLLGGAGQLQRHQEVRCFADPANEVVLQVDDRRLAGARRDGHVVEAEAPGILDGQCSTEAHTAVKLEVAAPRQG